MTMDPNLNAILAQSVNFESDILRVFNMPLTNQLTRTKASRSMCAISFEHAESVKVLVASGNYTSATAIIRLQYETLVRAIWLFYSATDNEVSKLMADLTVGSAKRSNKLPMRSEMLKKMEGVVPIEAMEPLLEIKEYSWNPLSSFVHGGIHAINRHSKGYPVELMVNMIRNSNGILYIAGMQVSVLSGVQKNVSKLNELMLKYLECLPNHKSYS